MFTVNDAKFLAPVPKASSEQEKQNNDVVRDNSNSSSKAAYSRIQAKEWDKEERRVGEDRRDRDKSKRRRFDQRSSNDRRVNQGLKVKI